MGLLFLVLGLLAIVTCILPWVAISRINRLENDLFDLRQEMKKAITGQATPRTEATPIIPIFANADTTPEVIPSQNPVAATQGTVTYEDFDWQAEETVPPPQTETKKQSTFEFSLGAKLPVWIGAISLVCAGFYLVKYSIDAGLLGPTTRTIIGLIFGLSMAAGGRILANHPRIPNALRMAQGIVGAGMITLTFTLYSAVHIHHIIEPVTGFCGMVAIVVATMVFALKLGQPVALFGMIGGFLAPALFSNTEPNFIALFSYLFVLYAGLQTVMYKQKWWTLSTFSLAGVFLWSLVSLSNPAFRENASILPIFVLAISSMTIFNSRQRIAEEGREDDIKNLAMGPHLLNLLAIAGSTILLIALQEKIHFDRLDWAMSGLLSLGLIGLAYVRPTIYAQAVWGKLASDIFLLAIYLPHTDPQTGAMVSLGLLAIYTLTPALILSKDKRDPKSWAITQTAGAISIFLTAYLHLSKTIEFGTTALWGSIALSGAIYSALQIKKYMATAKDDVVAIYALGTTSFLSIGLSIMLPQSYLPAAFALEIAAIFWIYQKLPIRFLQTIAQILMVIFAALNLDVILDFTGVIMTSLFRETSQLSPELFGIEKIYQTFLMPALSLALAYAFYSEQKETKSLVSNGLFGGVIALMLGASYIVIRKIFQGGDTTGNLPLAGFNERETITLMISVFGFLVLWFARIKNVSHVKIWGNMLIALAILRVAYFDIFTHNPLFDATQHVGTTPILNGITLTYGTGLLLVMYARFRNIRVEWMDGLQSLLKALALTFLLALTSLNVRQFFHGDNLTQGDISNSELYTYSIIWMLTGLGLLAYGIKHADRNLRLAALAFLTLTIGKVFLIDASELQGLYRIFSFLGLGVSLIALSMFYTRFMARNGEQGE